jgi:hypothetical protein
MGLAVSVHHHTWGLVVVCSTTHGACCFHHTPFLAIPLIYGSVLDVLLHIIFCPRHICFWIMFLRSPLHKMHNKMVKKNTHQTQSSLIINYEQNYNNIYKDHEETEKPNPNPN